MIKIDKSRSTSCLYSNRLFQNAYEKLIDKFLGTNMLEMDL